VAFKVVNTVISGGLEKMYFCYIWDIWQRATSTKIGGGRARVKQQGEMLETAN
jgi:hypothetical protein